MNVNEVGAESRSPMFFVIMDVGAERKKTFGKIYRVCPSPRRSKTYGSKLMSDVRPRSAGRGAMTREKKNTIGARWKRPCLQTKSYDDRKYVRLLPIVISTKPTSIDVFEYIQAYPQYERRNEPNIFYTLLFPIMIQKIESVTRHWRKHF